MKADERRFGSTVVGLVGVGTEKLDGCHGRQRWIREKDELNGGAWLSLGSSEFDERRRLVRQLVDAAMMNGSGAVRERWELAAAPGFGLTDLKLIDGGDWACRRILDDAAMNGGALFRLRERLERKEKDEN